MRAPRPRDAIWFVLLAFGLMAIRMIFATDAVVPCLEGTGCFEASLELPGGD